MKSPRLTLRTRSETVPVNLTLICLPVAAPPFALFLLRGLSWTSQRSALQLRFGRAGTQAAAGVQSPDFSLGCYDHLWPFCSVTHRGLAATRTTGRLLVFNREDPLEELALRGRLLLGRKRWEIFGNNTPIYSAT